MTQSIKAVARFQYLGNEVHVSVSDAEPCAAWEYSGPGGTYTATALATYGGFDYEVYRRVGPALQTNPHNYYPNWDSCREAAIKYAAGTEEWRD